MLRKIQTLCVIRICLNQRYICIFCLSLPKSGGDQMTEPCWHPIRPQAEGDPAERHGDRVCVDIYSGIMAQRNASSSMPTVWRARSLLDAIAWSALYVGTCRSCRSPASMDPAETYKDRRQAGARGEAQLRRLAAGLYDPGSPGRYCQSAATWRILKGDPFSNLRHAGALLCVMLLCGGLFQLCWRRWTASSASVDLACGKAFLMA